MWPLFPSLLAAALALIPSVAGAAAPIDETRVALVIGNSVYPDSPLHDSVPDARAMAETLTRLGFNVTKKENATFRDMVDALRGFGETMIRTRGTALFYFSGHGLQLEGENYLLPVDADFKRAYEIKYRSLLLAQVLDEMKAKRIPISPDIVEWYNARPGRPAGVYVR